MSSKRRIWSIVLVLTVMIIAVGESGLKLPHFPRPVDAVRLSYLKFNTVPELPWGQIFLVASGLERFPFFAGELVRGNVKLARRSGTDACPYVYSTPWGEVHGGLQDNEIIEGVLNEMLDLKVYENEHAAVNRGDVVLDVGAHLGVFARYAFLKGASRIVAYEPEPHNVACLKQTFAREITDGTLVLEAAAVSGSPGTISLLQHPNSSMNRTLERDVVPGLRNWEKKVFKLWMKAGAQPQVIEVPAVTIDDSLKRLKVEKVDFVKMDIEGAERYALAGAQRMMKENRPRMVLCIYHRPDDPKVLREIVMTAQPSYQLAEDGMHHSLFLY